MKKITTRTLALFLALITCFALAACGSTPSGGGNSAEAPSTNTSDTTDSPAAADKYIKVVIAGPSDPGNYLPFSADNAIRTTYQYFIYENLFDMFTTEELTPTLATGYERVGDGVYRVTIHDNIYDYNGEHITAEDVAYSYNKTIEMGERMMTVGDLDSVKVVDEYTVDLIFRNDALGSLERVLTSVPIVSQKSYEASETGFASDPVGTGPYYISEWLPGASITFKKNENYWNKDAELSRQNCDEIEVKFISEPAQVAIELETGNVDFAYNVSPQDCDNFANMDGFTVLSVPGSQIDSIGFNCHESCVFSDIRLRQAVCYAIDPAGILEGVYMGRGGVATALAVPEPEAGYIMDYVPEWKNQLPYEYNVEKAKELMAEAGYPNGGLKVRLMAKDTDIYRKTCQAIQAYLAEIGIEVEINCYENALYQTYRYQPDAYDFCLCAVSNTGMPYIPVGWKWYLGQDPSSGRNVLFMQDDKLQSLLDTALGLDTHNVDSVAALHSYVMDTACLYPYVYGMTNYVHVDTMSDLLIMNGLIFLPNMSTISPDFVGHN